MQILAFNQHSSIRITLVTVPQTYTCTHKAFRSKVLDQMNRRIGDRYWNSQLTASDRLDLVAFKSLNDALGDHKEHPNRDVCVHLSSCM